MKFINQIIMYVCIVARYFQARFLGIKIPLSEPLPDGNYIITDSGDKSCSVKLKRGRFYLKKMKKENKMKKTTVYLLIIIFLWSTIPCFAGRTDYTTGDSFLALSEKSARQAARLYETGRYRELESLVAIGVIKVPSQGTPVEFQNYHKGVSKVRLPGSETDWYTMEEGLTDRIRQR